MEASLGLRWNVWNRAPKPGRPRPQVLEVIGGFRSTRFDDVTADVTAGPVGVSDNGVISFAGVEVTPKSISYEGFYGGISYNF